MPNAEDPRDRSMGGRSAGRSADGRDRPARRGRDGPRVGLSRHDRHRLRVTYGIVVVGVALGMLGAATVGLLGASGRAGAAVLLVVCAAGCMAASLVTAVLIMVDEYRRIPVGRPRTLMALWFFLGAALLLVMSTGVAAG